LANWLIKKLNIFYEQGRYKMLINKKVAIIGVGKMGEILLEW
jgi:tRNA A37 threonylcarbamoyladenosine dehydratase